MEFTPDNISRFEARIRAEASKARLHLVQFEGRFERFKEIWFIGYAEGLENSAYLPRQIQNTSDHMNPIFLKRAILARLQEMYDRNWDQMMRIRSRANDPDDEAQEYFLGRAAGNSSAIAVFLADFD